MCHQLCEYDVQLGLQGKDGFMFRIQISGGLDWIEEMQDHGDFKVRELSLKLIQEYFGQAEDEPYEVTAQSQQFII